MHDCDGKGEYRIDGHVLIQVEGNMCATYFVDDGTAMEMLEIINDLNKKFGYETVSYEQIYPSGAPEGHDIYPKQSAPVGKFIDSQFTASASVWGFPLRNGRITGFNARAESLKKYDAWKRAYTKGRAFAPAKRFYENLKLPGGKSERYSFSKPDCSLLFLAAMVETSVDKAGNPFEVFTVITVDANASVSEIHDRMPLLLEADELALWMTDEEYADGLLNRQGPELVSAIIRNSSNEKEDDQFTLFD